MEVDQAIDPAIAAMDLRAGGMIKTLAGKYALSAGTKKEGDWRYEPISRTSGNVVTIEGELVGNFQFTPIDETPMLDGIFTWEQELQPAQDMRCIGITSGEIIQDIQLPQNSGAYFILPSMLNGAEYPSERDIVRVIEEYIYDNTGGPRGQLAVHPAAGTFVLQNAANEENPDGINAVDEILLRTGESISLLNGHLVLPMLGDDEIKAKKVFEDFTGALHTIRPLIMHDVPATGLTPNKRAWSAAAHRVGLVYSSAVPLDSYVNYARSAVEQKLHQKMAEAVIVAQYYGAVRQIAKRCRDAPGQAKAKTRVYLLPLGGGVFNNPMDSIARGMAQAAELLATRDPELFNLVEMQVLAWNGNPAEKRTFERELGALRKFCDEGGKRFEAPARRPPLAQETQQQSAPAAPGAASQAAAAAAPSAAAPGEVF